MLRVWELKFSQPFVHCFNNNNNKKKTKSILKYAATLVKLTSLCQIHSGIKYQYFLAYVCLARFDKEES